MTEPKPKPQRDEKTGRIIHGNQLALKHGLYNFLKSGRVPYVRGRQVVQRELVELRAGLEAQVPASGDPRRAVLIGQIVEAQGVVRLSQLYLKHVGLCRADKLARRIADPQPLLAVVARFMEVQRAAIAALGMDKKQAEVILAPYEVVEEEKGQ